MIAIISLLLAIIMPSLKKAKEMGRMAVCLSNHKTMVLAWKTYSTENHGKLINGHTHRGGNLEDNNHNWVEPPVRILASGLSQYAGGDENNRTELEHELNGIRGGTLFPYVENVKAYKCPSDRRSKMSPPIAIGSSFRTYSITAQMNGEGARPADGRNYFNDTIGVRKESQITSSDMRFVFIDDYDRRSYNMGSWTFGYSSSGNHIFGDPISVWHFKKCNFSYADGHASTYVWKDRRTHKLSRFRALGEGDPATDGNMALACANNEDLRFLGNGYRAH